MAMAETPRLAGGCGACAALPPAPIAEEGPGGIRISLPGIHCAGCISGVERALVAIPGVRSARVNLTLKRVNVEAAPEVTPGQLIAALDDAGYEAHELDDAALGPGEADPAGRDLLMRLGVAFFAMMNVMLLSVAVWSGAADATRDLFHWISALIAVPTVAFSARPFFVSALGALRGGRLNMDVPISLAILLAVGMSIWETAHSGRHAYFDAALSLTFFLLGGRYLDHRTRAIARSAASELTALEVPRATRLRGGAAETVRAAELVRGDLVQVLPGGRVPVDGIVETGESEIDRSLMTGESLPAFAAPGGEVHAGEVNLTGPLTVRVTAAGQDTALSRIAALVAVAEAGRANYSALADRAARAYAPVVHLLALAAFAAWMWIAGDARFALNVAVATLIITCPCALGLAVPAVTTAASGRLFRKGLLVKSGTALERLAEVDTVVFDKTGTLTMGAPEPRGLEALDPEARRVALALADGSAHPLARALAAALRADGVRPARLSGVREVPGYGVEGRLDGRPVRLGRAGWVGASPVADTATYLSVPDRFPLSVAFDDRLRPGAEHLVAACRGRGLDVMLLSGDVPAAVAAFARRVGIETFEAEARPEDKAARVADLSASGRKVLMVGDGLNDTAALAAAHVSVSPASALDAARVASDIVLMGKDAGPVADALDIAVKARRRIVENFAISTVYNVVAVPIALLGFATPLMAALAMSLSSITVSLNALRVR